MRTNQVSKWDRQMVAILSAESHTAQRPTDRQAVNSNKPVTSDGGTWGPVLVNITPIIPDEREICLVVSVLTKSVKQSVRLDF